MPEQRDNVKDMAEMLRSGATMLSYSCPECGSPLFRLKSGEIWCARCQKRVVIVSEGEDESSVTKEMLWESIEKTLQEKLITVNQKLETETDPTKMKDLAEIVSVLLSSLERLKRFKKS